MKNTENDLCHFCAGDGARGTLEMLPRAGFLQQG